MANKDWQGMFLVIWEDNGIIVYELRDVFFTALQTEMMNGSDFFVAHYLLLSTYYVCIWHGVKTIHVTIFIFSFWFCNVDLACLRIRKLRLKEDK